MPPRFLESMPVWVAVAGSLLAFLSASAVGFRLGRWRRARARDGDLGDMGVTMGGLLGLLGLLLAFTFGMAGARYDERKSLVVDEANAIGTAWLRAGLLAEPLRTEARSLLRDYTQVRLDAAASGERQHVEQAILASERIQGRLWDTATAAAAVAPTAVTALFVASVNDVIDMHGRRVARAVRNPISPVILGVLYGVSLLVLAAMGFARGVAGDRSAVATTLLVVVLSVVLGLILDLDRPGSGFLRVSQQAMRDVQASMRPTP